MLKSVKNVTFLMIFHKIEGTELDLGICTLFVLGMGVVFDQKVKKCHFFGQNPRPPSGKREKVGFLTILAQGFFVFFQNFMEKWGLRPHFEVWGVLFVCVHTRKGVRPSKKWVWRCFAWVSQEKRGF
jgi:hypothetical protein